jgi:hypothetical protein
VYLGSAFLLFFSVLLFRGSNNLPSINPPEEFDSNPGGFQSAASVLFCCGGPRHAERGSGASALLQLKNNARLFEEWIAMRGYTFKASGRMFRGCHSPKLWPVVKSIT